VEKEFYRNNCVRVSWKGVMSYFAAVNGVKQGGLLSPVLFVCILNLLLKGHSHKKIHVFWFDSVEKNKNIFNALNHKIIHDKKSNLKKYVAFSNRIYNLCKVCVIHTCYYHGSYLWSNGIK